MAAKLLHSLTDDNPELRKQIGCMTGILQLFDRHHIVTGRRIVSQSSKRLPSGSSHFNNDSYDLDSYNIHRRSAAKQEKYSNKNMLEKQRASTESSRASFSSSSRSSSFSSPECNKSAQPETSAAEQVIFSEPPLRESTRIQSNASPRFGPQALDLRGVVKDCIYREARGLPVKTIIKGEANNCILKHRDSPRPLQLPHTTDKSNKVCLDGKQKPVDLEDSFRVLAKLREAPWYFHEPRELSRSSSYASRDGSFPSVPKDAPRFSYDDREHSRLSFQSCDTSKSAQKLNELPRLSLDGRDVSIRNLISESKSNSLYRSPPNETNSSDTFPSSQQPLESQSRPPSVVAKLMGLEALPESDSKNKITSNSTWQTDHCDSFITSFKTADGGRGPPLHNASKNLWKEPTSPRWKNPDLVVKPIARLPIEPAPWKQLEGNRVSQKPTSRSLKVPTKVPDTFGSVYGEIKKRLKDLEFTQSGKDLRALKQILEAMDSKKLLDSRKEGQDSNFSSQRDYEQKHTTTNTNARILNQQKQQNDHAVNYSKTFESPIVIMKPAKFVKSGISASSVIPLDGFSNISKLQGCELSDSCKGLANGRTTRDQIPKSVHKDISVTSADIRTESRSSRLAQNSMRHQHSPKESTTTLVKSSGSISPRMQQKKLEFERRSRPPTPTSESSKPRRQLNKQQSESNSPGGRRRPKVSNIRQNGEQLSDDSETRTWIHHENVTAVQSADNTMSYPNVDAKVASSQKVAKRNNNQRQSSKVDDLSNSGLKSSPALSEGESSPEVASVGLEYPSPISVLDYVAYTNDAASPLKQMQETIRDDMNPISYDSPSKTSPSEINRKKLQNVENLVQKLRRLNSTHDESRTDYIASLCENANPDHRYISEVLLASGLLLRDLGSISTTFHLHSSGYPINPELFLVLEQTKASNLHEDQERSDKNAAAQRTSEKERTHRKLIFDVLNEILIEKLTLPEQPWLRPHKLVGETTLNAQKLLRELCLEVEELQVKKPELSTENEDDGLTRLLSEELMHHHGGSECWTSFRQEVSGLVLDVERRIFKDLVDEIVNGGGGAALRCKPGRRFRQLFPK